MVKYSCSKCLKEFSQKSHYLAHLNKKNPCENKMDQLKETLEAMINEAIDKKLTSLVKDKKVELNINNLNKINTNMSSKEKQETGLKRNPIDKYYTKPKVVKQCIEYVSEYVGISDRHLVVEPSAGNGSFIEEIKLLSQNYKFYDLEPEHQDIIKQDFLELDFTEMTKDYKKIHIIGNPPFGRQASLARKFIKKCCLFAKSISFILPKSFKKDSMHKCFDNYYHLAFEVDLDDNSFLVNGLDCDVPCVFQIWKLKKKPRKEVETPDPVNFKFVKKEENPDISFRRVGVYAGAITKDITDKSTQSHYFIKFINSKKIDDNLEKLKSVKFDFNNTVGAKSISKPELIYQFNKFL